MQRMVGGKSKVGWDVMRVANVGRMGVLWTFYLLYSYVLLLLLHQKPNSHRPQLPPSHVKRACIVTGVLHLTLAFPITTFESDEFLLCSVWESLEFVCCGRNKVFMIVLCFV